jgi:hypothetical protein
MTYLITFGAEPGKNAALAAAIKEMGEWGEFAPNSYLLASERTVRTIIETLQPLLGPEDSLAVLTASDRGPPPAIRMLRRSPYRFSGKRTLDPQ